MDLLSAFDTPKSRQPSSRSVGDLPLFTNPENILRSYKYILSTFVKSEILNFELRRSFESHSKLDKKNGTSWGGWGYGWSYGFRAGLG